MKVLKAFQKSIGISREIADRQKLVTELGGRAYLCADFHTAVYQNATLNFQGQAKLTNRGSTPAYDVTFRAKADIIPFPVSEDFDFPLPNDTAGGSVSLIAPGVQKIITRVVPGRVPDDQVTTIKIPQPPRCLAMWGIVNYRDAFKEARYLKFAFIIYWIEMAGKDKDGNPLKPLIMSADMAHHNEAN